MKILRIKKTFLFVLILTMAATTLWAAGATDQPTTAAEKEYVTDPTTGKQVLKPQYGGTITTVAAQIAGHADSYIDHGALAMVSGVVESLATYDWAIDRDVWDLAAAFQPMEGFRGQLAESWSMPDETTFIWRIRQGVNFHDKAPVNGRELNAHDVEAYYHRMLALGEFADAEPPPSGALTWADFETVTATDDWTVVIKLSKPRMDVARSFLEDLHDTIYPIELYETYDNLEDWRTIVGSGPLMISDFVEGVSLTFVKNPDYWGYDEKYPENRLPYIDQLDVRIMPEPATRRAALRTGKLDMVLVLARIQSPDVVASLQQTNPELSFWPHSFRSETSSWLQVGRPPFDDIRVRQAMQMAINLEELNDTYFLGMGSWKPESIIGKNAIGYAIPFDEWPEEVKKAYSYDPAGAEALLDAAGYPRDADGIRFKTTLHHPATRYAGAGNKELMAGYWAEIGVDVEIDVTPDTDHSVLGRSKDWDGMWSSWRLAADDSPMKQLGYARSSNHGNINDPVYDAMVDAINAATTLEEAKRLSREADLYWASQHYAIWGTRASFFTANQPWIIGFNGELTVGKFEHWSVPTRLWIDHELKAEMGS